MANIKSIGGNPIVLGLDGLTDDAKAALGSGAKLSAAAESLLGTPDTAQWAQRVSTGSGAATVRSVQGAAEVQDGELVPVRIAGISSTDAHGGELDAIEWTAQTLRAAGSVADMLYSDHVDVRVGVVDLGTLTWTYDSTNQRFGTSGPISYLPVTSNTANVTTEIVGINLLPAGGTTTSDGYNVASQRIWIRIAGTNPEVTTPADFTAWLAAHCSEMYYQLATPTTTPIRPALPMTYRVEQGGSESIIVPDGEISAAPVLTVAEGESAADVVMDALACIATPDGPVATANHAVGTYLTMQGKLYKVTSAIAVGETITAGTNVTATTVMDEILALN